MQTGSITPWVVAVALAALAYMQLQTITDLRRDATARDARYEQMLEQQRIDAKKKDFKDGLGQDEPLSDYLRDHAGRLWGK